jgi:hypothetical protein
MVLIIWFCRIIVDYFCLLMSVDRDFLVGMEMLLIYYICVLCGLPAQHINHIALTCMYAVHILKLKGKHKNVMFSFNHPCQIGIFRGVPFTPFSRSHKV